MGQSNWATIGLFPPAAMAVALNGIVVVFVVSSGRVRERINSMVDARKEFDRATTDEPPPPTLEPAEAPA